jgi:CHAT domain
VAVHLQLSHQPGVKPTEHQLILTLTDKGQLPRTASVGFSFELSAQDREAIRWYLEDYLELHDDPASSVAAHVEQRMQEIGHSLFTAIFNGSNDARGIWETLSTQLGDARIEVTTSAQEATIPWELLRDPRRATWLALHTRAFVRSQWGSPAGRNPQQPKTNRVRILLVICRPQGRTDVPFRSVASQIVRLVEDKSHYPFDLHVLRPPTLTNLAKALRVGNERRSPYHIIHFDGHGIYKEPRELRAAGHLISTLDAHGEAHRGFLEFEDSSSKTNRRFVDGSKLGSILRDSGVAVLILNACQSAYAEALTQPQADAKVDVRDELKGYGSLAGSVVDHATTGVVAMRYSIYVGTICRRIIR